MNGMGEEEEEGEAKQGEGKDASLGEEVVEGGEVDTKWRVPPGPSSREVAPARLARPARLALAH